MNEEGWRSDRVEVTCEEKNDCLFRREAILNIHHLHISMIIISSLQSTSLVFSFLHCFQYTVLYYDKDVL